MEQFGFVRIAPGPDCPRASSRCSGFTSGTTSGTSASIRWFFEFETTSRPAAANADSAAPATEESSAEKTSGQSTASGRHATTGHGADARGQRIVACIQRAASR